MEHPHGTQCCYILVPSHDSPLPFLLLHFCLDVSIYTSLKVWPSYCCLMDGNNIITLSFIHHRIKPQDASMGHVRQRNMCIRLSVCFYVSLSLSLCLYAPLCLAVSCCVSLCLAVSRCVSHCLSVSLYVSLCPSVSLFVFLCLSVYGTVITVKEWLEAGKKVCFKKKKCNIYTLSGSIYISACLPVPL